MRIPSGVIDQYIYFVAVDATDFTTRETGLSSFTVYRSRNGAAAAAMTTPTINQVDSTNMPGVYELLVDEDTGIGSGNDSEEMVLHIEHAGMAPVTRAIEIYRPKMTTGQTVTVASGQVEADVQAIANSIITSGTLNSTAVDEIADGVWDEAKAGHVVAGTFGEEVQAHALASEVSALNDLSAAEVNAEVDTALGEYDAPTKAELDAALGALNDLSAAQVNAEVDAAFTTTMADSVATDGSIPTREEALLMVSRFLFERSVSSTTVTVTKEDGSTSSMTFALDDANSPTSITRSG